MYLPCTLACYEHSSHFAIFVIVVLVFLLLSWPFRSHGSTMSLVVPVLPGALLVQVSGFQVVLITIPSDLHPPAVHPGICLDTRLSILTNWRCNSGLKGLVKPSAGICLPDTCSTLSIPLLTRSITHLYRISIHRVLADCKGFNAIAAPLAESVYRTVGMDCSALSSLRAFQIHNTAWPAGRRLVNSASVVELVT